MEIALAFALALLIGIVIFLVVSALVSLPIWLLWNWAAPIYFTALPAAWIHVPFLHVMGLVFLVLAVRRVLFSRTVKVEKA